MYRKIACFITLFTLFFTCYATAHATKIDIPTRLDTIEYRVYIASDRAGVEYFGGEQVYRKKIDELFRRTNEFWNNGSDKFKYYFRYVPDLQLIYDGSSKVIEQFFSHNFQSPYHDVLLIIDSRLDYDDEPGGWYCRSAENNLNIVACRGRSKTDFEDIFDQGYRGVAHEFGHYRGVTDLYADRVYKDKNPINNIQYEPDSCIMNNHHKTNHWSSYAVNIINHTALSKRPLRDFPGFFKNIFPENILVTLAGKAKNKEGVTLRLYGSRAKHNDFIVTPYRTFETNKKGQYLITDVPNLYDRPKAPLHTDDLPYNRWFTFLLEVEYKGEKKYVWLPEYEVQNIFFEGQTTYYITVIF